MAKTQSGTQTRALLLLTTLFFMWGFLTSMNDILIPYLKVVFSLSHFQAMQVQFAFFGAYFVGSLLYFLTSARFGDPIARIGYQRGAVLGLVIAGLGALLFYPASAMPSYPLFLTGLFTIGLGFTLLQISANPYVIAIGDESTASSRLNLCQGVNSLGTTLGPLIGGTLILGMLGSSETSSAEAIQLPYLVFAGMLFALAAFIAVANLPRILPPGTVQRGASVLRKPRVLLGILAIFCYVGAEVSVGSILIDYFGLEEVRGIPKDSASAFVALYWGGLMIGRFLGAVLASSVTKTAKAAALVGIPLVGFFFLAFLFARGREMSYGETVTLLLPWAAFLGLNIVAFAIGAAKPGRTVGVFAVCCAVLLGTAIFQGGSIAFWSVIAVGLFNSIMWSNIFALSIRGLGKFQSQASSLLVMAIVGGALLPLVQGGVADEYGIANSFAVPLVAYLYLAYYGWWGKSIGEDDVEAAA